MALDDKLKREIASLGSATQGLYSFIDSIENGEAPNYFDRRGHGLQRAIIEHQNEMPPAPEELQHELNIIKNSSEEDVTRAMNRNLRKAYGNSSKKLVEKVSENYGEILSEIGGEGLIALVLEIPVQEDFLDNEDYKEITEQKLSYTMWKEKLIEKDIEFYLNTVGSVVRDILIESKNEDGTRKYSNMDVLEYMEELVGHKQSIFVRNFINDVAKFDKGKKSKNQKMVDSSIDESMTKDYLSQTIPRLSDENKAKTYEQLGIVYTGKIAQDIEVAQNEIYRKQTNGEP